MSQTGESMRKPCLTILAVLHFAVPQSSPAQEPTNQLLRDTRQHDRVLVPVLEVREFSGEFERWGREMTVNAPKAEVFRWSTPVSGTASARWSVLDGPPGSGAAVVGSGSAGSAPQAGSVTVFRIDFRKLVPSGPPAGGTTYWVVVEPVDAAGQAGSESMPVQVIYAAQLDIAAFAGREADIVAQKQMALSKTSKLAFLQALVAKSVELLSEDSDALVAATTDDIPDATVRLTPREPVSFAFSAAAVPDSSKPHQLEFTTPLHVMSHTSYQPMGLAQLRPGGGIIMRFNLEPEQIYLLDVRVQTLDPVTLTVTFHHQCLVDFQQQPKDFVLADAMHHQLLATVQRTQSAPADQLCFFTLNSREHSYSASDHWFLWAFLSAELTKLSNQ